MKKIKILFAINCMNIGGAPSVVFHQMKLLDKQRFEPHLLTLYASKPANFFSQIDFIPEEHIHQFALRKRSVFDFRTLWSIYRHLRKEKYHIVYTHLFLANFLVRALSVLARVPIIFSFEHSTYFNKSRWQIVMDRALARLTDKIIVSTESVKTFTAQQEQLPLDLFEVIRNPVVIPHRSSVDLNLLGQTLGSPVKHPLFLTVGRFSEEKGQLVLLEAAKLVHARYPEANFLIVGHGPHEEVLREYVLTHEMDNYVNILHAPHRAKEYYYLADWFVLPSLREGQSMVVEEAMTAGLPVIASKLEGMGEIIKDGVTGFTIESGNPDALAQVIGKAIELNAERDVLSLRSHELAKKMFSATDRVRLFEVLCIKYYEQKKL